ncbi:hypothetical protein WN53_07270 [Serratia fonticola]|nr:hypothetical protein WN53_07270 [Serratia fonticola]
MWLWRFPSFGPLEADEEYLTTALRLISGSVLIFAMGSLRNSWGSKTVSLIKGLIVFGFFYTSAMGLYYHAQAPDLRLQIKTVSTMTAYIYVLQSLLTMYVITSLNLRYKSQAISLVILVTLWILMLTETRSSLLFYPIILLLVFCRRHHFSIKMIAISCGIVVLTAAAFHFFESTTDRLIGTATELNNYQKGDGNSSVGSRISMWKAGVDAIKHYPAGQSADTRLIGTTRFINQHEGGNPEALRNLVFHLHNDMIEAGSLQGIGGMAALLLFFTLSLYACLTSVAARPILLLVLLPTFVIGLVDTLFIDHRYVTSLTLLLAIYLCLPPPANKNTCSNVE